METSPKQIYSKRTNPLHSDNNYTFQLLFFTEEDHKKVLTVLNDLGLQN